MPGKNNLTSQSIGAVRHHAISELLASGLTRASAALDCDVLLSFVLDCDRGWLFAHQDQTLSQEACENFYTLITKRKTGLPVAYLVSTKEFFGLDFTVTPDALIPKADTEVLVEKTVEALLKIAQTHKHGNNSAPLVFFDLFTGSGCVAIAVVSELYKQGITCQTLAYDLMPKALTLATKNATTLLPVALQKNMHFIEADLAQEIPVLSAMKHADVISANPPYVPHQQTIELLNDGRSEPAIALDGGTDGLTVIRNFLPHAYQRLKQGGLLLLECNAPQAQETSQLFIATGFRNTQIHNDLAHHPRIITGRK